MYFTLLINFGDSFLVSQDWTIFSALPNQINELYRVILLWFITWTSFTSILCHCLMKNSFPSQCTAYIFILIFLASKLLRFDYYSTILFPITCVAAEFISILAVVLAVAAMFLIAVLLLQLWTLIATIELIGSHSRPPMPFSCRIYLLSCLPSIIIWYVAWWAKLSLMCCLYPEKYSQFCAQFQLTMIKKLRRDIC